MAFSNWIPGEPNNLSFSGEYEHYLGFLRRNATWGRAFEWNDFTNTPSEYPLSNFGFVCEFNLN